MRTIPITASKEEIRKLVSISIVANWKIYTETGIFFSVFHIVNQRGGGFCGERNRSSGDCRGVPAGAFYGAGEAQSGAFSEFLPAGGDGCNLDLRD